MSKKKPQLQTPALQWYWYEFDKNESAGTAWGQLVGNIHRLAEVADEFATLSKRRDVRKRLRLLENLAELYLYRAYELRERAIHLLGIVTGDSALAGAAKKFKGRTRALDRLRPRFPELVREVERLLDSLNDDVLLRNRHTHEQFLSVGLFSTDLSIYDPEEMLRQVENHPRKRGEIESLLRAEIRKFSAQQREKIGRLCATAWHIAEAADRYVRATL